VGKIHDQTTFWLDHILDNGYSSFKCTNIYVLNACNTPHIKHHYFNNKTKILWEIWKSHKISFQVKRTKLISLGNLVLIAQLVKNKHFDS
jgi:hypothetical protein